MLWHRYQYIGCQYIGLKVMLLLVPGKHVADLTCVLPTNLLHVTHVPQALADADHRIMRAGVELSDLQRQLAEAKGQGDASQVCYGCCCSSSAWTSHITLVCCIGLTHFHMIFQTPLV